MDLDLGTANLGHSVWSQAHWAHLVPMAAPALVLRTLLLEKVAAESFGVFTAFVKNGKIFYTKCFEIPVFLDKFIMKKEMTFEDFLFHKISL